MEFAKSNDKVLECATYALDIGATRLVLSVEKPLRLFFLLPSFVLSFFLGTFFLGALLLLWCVNFKQNLWPLYIWHQICMSHRLSQFQFHLRLQLHLVLPLPASISNFRCCEWAINLCILLELLRRRVVWLSLPCAKFKDCFNWGKASLFQSRRGFALAAFAFALGVNNR